MWTKEKEERFLELTDDLDMMTVADVAEAAELEFERNDFIEQQLARQGETRERQPNDKEFLQLAAKEVSSRLPDGWGFILFVFPFGEGGRIGYVSNAQRETAVAALKEWLLKQSPENWLKHVD